MIFVDSENRVFNIFLWGSNKSDEKFVDNLDLFRSIDSYSNPKSLKK